MVSEGGAVQFHERRGSSSLQHFSRWAGPQAPGDLANKPLSPASRSRIPKMPRCSSAHEKPGLLHRLISCAQSLQPSLTLTTRFRARAVDRLTTQTHGAGSQNPRPSMLMRIGHVCNNNAVLVLHSPGNLACCAG